MERPERRDYSKAAPKQNHSNGQGGKGKQDQPHHNGKESGKAQHGKNHGFRVTRNPSNTEGSTVTGEPHNPGLKGKGTTEAEWMGPDITGGPSKATEWEFKKPGGRGKRAGLEASGGHRRSDMDLDMELDLAINHQECEDSYNERGSHLARRGSFPHGRGGQRGAGRHATRGGRGGSMDGNYLSSNQYYSLMANGDYDVDSCGEIEATEVEMQPHTGANAHNLARIEGGSELQVIEFQGGTSSAPGMTPIC